MTSIETVHKTLESGDFEAAFAVLEKNANASRDPTERALLSLEAATIYLLYGTEALPSAQLCLDDALRENPSLSSDPVHRSLQAELMSQSLDGEQLMGGEKLQQALELALEARLGPPRARLHAGVALVNMGQPEIAAECLDTEIIEGIPKYLHARFWSWRGAALEDCGRYRDASIAYGNAADNSRGIDKASALMDRAAMLLELDEPHEALKNLEEVKNEQSHAPWLDEASRLYLEARAHLMLDNPHQARERAEEARRLELESGEPSYGAALVLGQSLAALGEWDEALILFHQAIELANGQDKTYARHEFGLAQLDSGTLEEARETLVNVVADPEYDYRAEALADLSEVEYRLGNFDAAEQAAKQALAFGAVVPASLTLANVAYEYYRLDDALGHYARVIDMSPPGSREWVIAQQMSADTLVQQGWKNPAKILEHARAAHEHVDAADEWKVTLEGYMEKAETMSKDAGSKALN